MKGFDLETKLKTFNLKRSIVGTQLLHFFYTYYSIWEAEEKHPVNYSLQGETIQVASDATRKIPRCALVCAAINAAAHLFMGTSMTGFCCARAGGRKGTHSRFSRIGSSEMTNVSVFIAQDIQHVRPRQLLQAHGARQHAAD